MQQPARKVLPTLIPVKVEGTETKRKHMLRSREGSGATGSRRAAVTIEEAPCAKTTFVLGFQGVVLLCKNNSFLKAAEKLGGRW